MRSLFARTLLGLLCLAATAGFALPPIFIRNASDQPWLLGTEACFDDLDIRIEAPGEPVSNRSWCLDGPVTIPPGGEATIHLLPPAGPRDVVLRLHRGPERAAVPNAQVTFSFSPERSAVHIRCLPGEPLQGHEATLTIGGTGRVHGASPAAPAPGTPAGTEASSGRGGRVELPSPAPPPPAGSTLPQAAAPEAGPEGLAAETFELVNATKGPGGTWYLWWSSPGGAGPGLRITGASGKLTKKGKSRYGIGIKAGERVTLTRTGRVADVKRIGLYSYDAETTNIHNPPGASLVLYDGAGAFAPAVQFSKVRPDSLPYLLEGNVLTLTGKWRPMALPGAGVEPAAAPVSSLPAGPAGTAGGASLGSATPESRLEGEVVLVNPEATGATWRLRWEAAEGEDPGVAFSEGDLALPIRTVAKDRTTRELQIPPGHRATLRPTGARVCKRILLLARHMGSLANPFKASLDLTFLGADSRIAVHYRSMEPARPPYLIAGNVLIFTEGSWGPSGPQSAGQEKQPSRRVPAPSPAKAVPPVPGPGVPGNTQASEGVVVRNGSRRAWFLEWSGPDEGSSGLAFGAGIKLRTINKGKRYAAVIPRGATARLTPAGSVDSIKSISLMGHFEGRQRANPYSAILAMTFNGALSRVAVTHRRGVPGVLPYTISGQVLTLTGPGWDHSPAERKRKAPSGPAPAAPSPAAAGTPAGVQRPKLKGPGKRPRLDADPPPAASALPPPAPSSEGTVPASPL